MGTRSIFNDQWGQPLPTAMFEGRVNEAERLAEEVSHLMAGAKLLDGVLITPETLRTAVAGWDEVIRELRARPEDLRTMNARAFEELVAELLSRQGFQVELTPRTGDAGADILCYRSDIFGEQLHVVECKRYYSKPVGIQIVQRFKGAVLDREATSGLLVTTSRYTRHAVLSAEKDKLIKLADFEFVKQWIRGHDLNSSSQGPPPS